MQENSYERAGRVPRMGLEIGYVRNSMYWKNLPTPHEKLGLYKSQSFSYPKICRARFHVMMFVSRPYYIRPPLAANLKLSEFSDDEIKQLESLGDKLKRPYRTYIPGWSSFVQTKSSGSTRTNRPHLLYTRVSDHKLNNNEHGLGNINAAWDSYRGRISIV